ncbi:hypothetical protein Droror1_Dr00014838 [Drosera rotundifolia]
MIQNSNMDIKDQNGLSSMSQTVKEHGTLGTDFHRLPVDVVGSVSRHLNVTDYISFRRVCKEFHKAAPLPISTRLKQHNVSLPWLMFFKNDESTGNLVDPINSLHFINILPHLEGGKIFYSSRDGIMLHKDKTYYNPFSKAGGEPPPYNNVLFMHDIAFSSFPSSQDYVAVGIFDDADRSEIICFGSTDQKWASGMFNFEEFRPSLSSPVYHKGKFYFLDNFCRLARLDVDRIYHIYESRLSTSSRQKEISHPFYESYLVEHNGELLIVGLYSRFKFNYSRQKYHLHQRYILK